MAQYQEDRGQLEAQFKQFRQAREQLVTDVRGRLDEMHGRLNGKEQELAEAQRRIEELQRSHAEPARLAKRQAEVHELEVTRLRERLETAEVKVRSKVAELAALKEELAASRQDAQSADRAMRDQLSQVEERLASTTRDLQLSQLPQPVAEPEEVGELRRQLSAERHRRERLLKESNERLRKAHQVMSKMRKTLEKMGVFQGDESAADAADEAGSGSVEILDQVPATPQPMPRPKLPKPTPRSAAADLTLLPEIVEVLAEPEPAVEAATAPAPVVVETHRTEPGPAEAAAARDETALAPEDEFSDDLPVLTDED